MNDVVLAWMKKITKNRPYMEVWDIDDEEVEELLDALEEARLR